MKPVPSIAGRMRPCFPTPGGNPAFCKKAGFFGATVQLAQELLLYLLYKIPAKNGWTAKGEQKHESIDEMGVRRGPCRAARNRAPRTGAGRGPHPRGRGGYLRHGYQDMARHHREQPARHPGPVSDTQLEGYKRQERGRYPIYLLRGF